MSADLAEVVEATARALYEATRADLRADDPMIADPVPWEHAPPVVQHEWREGMLPVVAAAAPLIAAQVRAQVRAQIAAEIVAWRKSLVGRPAETVPYALDVAARIARGVS